MRATHPEPDTIPRARIPADVEAPDKIVYGLTARQIAILAIAAVTAYALYRTLGPVLPRPVLLAVLTPVGAVAIMLALGRRDGMTMDRWLLAALRQTRAPAHLTPIPTPMPALGVLRFPAQTITAAGTINTGAHTVALVACTTVNIGLRTGAEQAAVIGGFGRWLNSLTAPVQIRVSAARVDLSGHATRIRESAQTITHPALGDAARGYADFLDDLALTRDPLWRTITIAVTSTTGHPTARTAAAAPGRPRTTRSRAPHSGAPQSGAPRSGRDADVLRRADQAAAALAALGAETTVLDGTHATAVLTCAADPYTPADVSWGRARPDHPITARPTSRPVRKDES